MNTTLRSAGPLVATATEWLEADGAGGFASGPIDGPRTRRYHGLLVAAGAHSGDRHVLVAGMDVWLECSSGTFPLSTQCYGDGVLAPDGSRFLERFHCDPWPTWSYRFPGHVRLTQELCMPRGESATTIVFRLQSDEPFARLHVRPFLAGRGQHELAREGEGRFEGIIVSPSRSEWRSPGALPLIMRHSGSFACEQHWYRGFYYAEEERRGFDHAEDLFAPGVISFDLRHGTAGLLLSADLETTTGDLDGEGTRAQAEKCLASERQRRGLVLDPLMRAAEAYLVERSGRAGIIAGYPWFGEWGRDTFIALRGLGLATGRLGAARDILLAWVGSLEEGLLPNRFHDAGGAPEFNSVDASLWFVVCVWEWLSKAALDGSVAPRDRRTLVAACRDILRAYTRGTRLGIRADADGLLAAGTPDLQLTWMDAKVGRDVITRRMGKPVEVQALWFNALRAGEQMELETGGLAEKALRSFSRRFTRPDGSGLHDVVDVNGVRGSHDATIRPNQILAVGGLPCSLLSGRAAVRVVETVARHLLTPWGLRSLAPEDPAYCGSYVGGPSARDRAYHQGTVWPWLLGPFVEAWVRVRGNSPDARRSARERFLTPVLTLMSANGHVPEIADGDAPHTPRGCPFQAWSLGEILRLHLEILKDESHALETGRS